MGSLRDLHTKDFIIIEVPREIILYKVECSSKNKGPKLISATYRAKVVGKYSLEWEFYPIRNWQAGGIWHRSFLRSFREAEPYAYETPEEAWKSFIKVTESERDYLKSKVELQESLLKKAKKRSGLE